jgi:hypothetical protein
MASIGSVFNNYFFSMNLFRFVNIENYQRRSLLVRRLFGGAPVR